MSFKRETIVEYSNSNVENNLGTIINFTSVGRIKYSILRRGIYMYIYTSYTTYLGLFANHS